MELTESILAWAQWSLLLLLAVFGWHRGALAFTAWRLTRRQRREAGSSTGARAAPTDQPDDPTPAVTIQLPIFNERYVVRRLLHAVAKVDWPRDRLIVQVLDDSTDHTSAIVRQTIQELPRELRVEHLQRENRIGFKAGALAAGLADSTTPYVAVFDADFVPPPDVLKRLVPQLVADENIGLVQARWGHLNRSANLLTRCQAMLLDGHFGVEHFVRAQSGNFFNFNGTAGIFRRACLEDAGGWQHDTLTEDMDLSYRAQLHGYRFVYDEKTVCPAELPTEAAPFLVQQHRWGKGSTQVARKLLGRVLRASQVNHSTKVEACFHLLGNFAFPLLLALVMVSLPLQLIRYELALPVRGLVHAVEAALLWGSVGSVLVYYLMAQWRLRQPVLGSLWVVALVPSIGAALAVTGTHGVIQGLFGETGTFERTPKRNEPSVQEIGKQQPPPKSYRSPRGILPLWELLFAVWAGTTATFAACLGLWTSTLFHGLFGLGFAWAGVATILGGRRRRVPEPDALAESAR